MGSDPQATVALPSLPSVAAAFEAAEANTHIIERWVRIGGDVIQLRIAGESLVEPLTRALAHLIVEPHKDPELVINCWDRANAGTAPPLPALDSSLTDGVATDRGDEGLVFWGSPALVATTEDGWALWRPAFGAFSAMVTDATVAWHWVEAAHEIRYWDVAAPFKAILHRWARRRGYQLLHAGAVGTDDGAVLLVGSPGSGKSTTSLVCLEAGMSYLGDDYVMVSLDPEPRVHSVSCAAKLEIPQAQRNAHLMPEIWNAGRLGEKHEEKAVAFVDHSPGGRIASLPLKMVLVPRVSGKPGTRASKLSGGGAFLALAPSTIIQMPGSRDDEFAAMGDLVRQVPAAALELGSDLASIPPVIEELIRQCD